ENGEPFLPKGINMVCKDKEKGYIGDYTAEDFKFLKEHGFNLVRLGLIWDGAEHRPGEISEEYFEKIDRIIELASKEEISVFLDMHQDLYGVKFEDGAPEWATITDGEEHIRTELWSESYLISPAVQHAFDNFWKNTKAPDGKGVRTHYIELLKYIANRYANNPYVIGYDVMNEPFLGSAGLHVAAIMGSYMPEGDMSALEDFSKIEEMIGKIVPITEDFETNVLNPFYDEVAQAIRSVDKETIIMFESNYFANAGVPTFVRPAIDEHGKTIENLAYVPHGYDILVDTEAYKTGGCDRIAFIFSNLFDAAKKMNIPTLVGEWGCYPNAEEPQKEQARFLLDYFKENSVGNVYYDFSHIKDGGILSVLAK
ncbi:MAG: cellulase family glycosylhydrolase, partial [Lachnospiraceae bacterium]|nr:cellulase family glycosylhydrolase [Lachnospiraceae bacterium]